MNEPDPSEIKTALQKYLETERIYNDLLTWAKARKVVYNRDVLPVLYALRQEGIVETNQRDGVVRLQTKREHWTPPYEHTTPADARRVLTGETAADARAVAADSSDSMRTVYEPSPEKIHDDANGFAAFDPIPPKVTSDAMASVTTDDIAAVIGGISRVAESLRDDREDPEENGGAGDVIPANGPDPAAFPEVRTLQAFAPEQPTAEHTPAAKRAFSQFKHTPASERTERAGNTDSDIGEWLLLTLFERTVPAFSRDLFQELALDRGVAPSDIRGSKRLSNRFSKIKKRLRRQGLIAASTASGSPEQLWGITDAGRAAAWGLTQLEAAALQNNAASPFAVLQFLAFCFDASGFIAGDVKVEACSSEIETASKHGFIAPVVRAGAGLQLRLTDLGIFVAAGFREAHRAVDLLNQHADLFRELAEFPGRPR